MSFYLSYDNAGFTQALEHGTDEHFDNTHTVFEQMEQILNHGAHDLYNHHCKSYQVYDQDGCMIFNSEIKEAA